MSRFVVLLHFDLPIERNRRHEFVTSATLKEAVETRLADEPKVGAYEHAAGNTDYQVQDVLRDMRRAGTKKLCKFCKAAAVLKKQDRNLVDLLQKSIDRGRQRKLPLRGSVR